MSHKKRRVPEFQAPDNHVLTEKTKLIKDLAEKQLNTSISLKEELTREKLFTKSNEFISITTYTQGEKTLDSYKKFAQLIDNFEELKSYGLTDNEIDFFNDYNKDKDNIFFKYKNLSKIALEQKLEYIFDLIEKGKSKTTTEIENKKQVHPINNLQQIHNELFGHLNMKTVVPSLKKRRKRIKKYLETPNQTEITTVSSTNKRTKWDVKEIEIITKETLYVHCNLNQNKINETKNEKIYIGGKLFVGWKPNNNILSDCKKISVEEIKNINRFKNYEIGKPSKILFIKNLSKNITEEILVNIFGHFDTEEKKITYRLLTGKMKGQAFITFNSVDQATNALESINGYIFSDKPIIIEYGKSK